MNKAYGTVQHGEVKLDHPVDWDDGTRVEVNATNGASHSGKPEPVADRQRIEVGVRPEFRDALLAGGAGALPDALWPLSDEETELLIARMDAIPPVFQTDEEYEAFREFLRTSKLEQKDLVRKSWDVSDGLFP